MPSIAFFCYTDLSKKADRILKAIEGYEITSEQKTRIRIVRDHLYYIDTLIDRVDTCINTMVNKYEGYIVLLCTIPDVDRSSAITILFEIGVDMTQFRSSKRLCCWTGLTPDNNESARNKKSCPYFTCRSLPQTCAGASCPRSREG